MAFFESKTEKKKGKNLFKETIIKQSNISIVIMVLLTIGAVIYGLFVYKNNVIELFLTFKNWKNVKCPSVNDWLN